ncbi:MAG: hypothetical protein Q4D07_00935 [Selenomonadaceae bacterium]|nr:hypothetical protein [Selenomonadaceae bacterium]
MPLETSAATQAGGIRPIERPSGSQPTSRAAAVRSPFAPETNVSIRNSISDMAGVLLRISGEAEDVAEGMTPDVQRLVNNIMKNSFSLGETLGKNLGSTVESQRFAMDQLNTLSRLLTQMGNLARQTSFGEMSQPLATILSQLKTAVTQENGNLEPVLLHKLAYELLDRKEPEVIPAELLELLSQQPMVSGGEVPVAGDSNLDFLKQLVAYFMPATPREEAQLQGENNAAPQPQDNQLPGNNGESVGQQPVPTGESSIQEPAQNREQPLPATGQTMAREAENTLSGQSSQPPAQTAAPQGDSFSRTAQPEAQTESYGTGPEAQEEAKPLDRSQQMLNDLGRPFRPSSNTGLQNLNAGRFAKSFDGILRDITGRPIEANENPAARLARLSAESMAERRSNSPAANRPSSAMNSHVFFRQPAIENSVRTMEAMKGLARLLSESEKVSESDRQLLLDFVNGEEEIINEKDARQLNLLLRLCQKNLPASVQQAAIQQNLPALPRLWAFMQLCDLATLKDTKPRRLRNAGRDIAEFAGTVKESMAGTARMTQSGQRTMSFMLPLYMGEEGQSYPCYVSVFDEEKYPEDEYGEEDKSGEKQRETWLRFCVLTENIGAVEITCRLYESTKIDVRVFFSSSAAVGEFRDYIPEFVHSFDESPLELVGLKLGVAKAK